MGSKKGAKIDSWNLQKNLLDRLDFPWETPPKRDEVIESETETESEDESTDVEVVPDEQQPSKRKTAKKTDYVETDTEDYDTDIVHDDNIEKELRNVPTRPNRTIVKEEPSEVFHRYEGNDDIFKDGDSDDENDFAELPNENAEPVDFCDIVI